MSTLHTESFIAYQAVNSSDDTSTTGNDNARLAVAANLRRGGHAVSIGDQTANQHVGFAIRPDPVNPDRNALFFSAGSFAANVGKAGIRKSLPVVLGEAIVGGFSLYIPNEYVKSTAAATNPILRVIATTSKDASWDVSSSGNTHTVREAFRVTQDLQIRWGVDAAQSQKTLGTGRTYFIEYRISSNDVRVWIDDTLVMQKTGLGLGVECIALLYEQTSVTSGSSQFSGAPARWAIGNWYNLVEDANAPNVRLGPSTRVIGVRPNTDVVANFIRPGGYTANAQVAALDLVDAPPASLQSSTVGDQDIYTSTTDTTTASGTTIHSVGVKVLASNLEANPHSIRAIVRASNGSEFTAQKAREMRLMTAISTKNLNGIARRPTDGKLFAVGDSIALLTNANNGQGAWTTVSDDGGSIHYTCITFRSDGWGVIGRSDGKFQTIAPGTDVPGAAITLASQSASFACQCAITMPSGRIALGCLSSAFLRGPSIAQGTPDVSGNWTRITSAAGNLGSMAHAPAASGLGTGSGRLVVSNNANPASSYRSDDEGATWSTSSNISFTGTPYICWDGNAFIAFQNLGTFNTAYQRRSPDGITWNTVSGGTQAPGTSAGAALAAAGDPDVAGQSVFVGNNGAVQVSLNGIDYRVLPQIGASGNIRGLAKAANGDWVMIGNAGYLAVYSVGLVDGSMPALAGYTPYANYTSVNPATSAAWTAAEASASQFGMRLTS
jgi:hypothetical protein